MKVSTQEHCSYLESSGDLSPIHTDETYARSFGLNSCVVHGTHLIEIALGRILNLEKERSYSGIVVEMLKPIYPEEEFELVMLENEAFVQVKFLSDSLLKFKITLNLTSPSSGMSPENEITNGTIRTIFEPLREVSKYVGMTFPGSNGILRQISISKAPPTLSSPVLQGTFSKLFEFENVNIRATSIISRNIFSSQIIEQYLEETDLCSKLDKFRDAKVLLVGFGTLGRLLATLLKNVPQVHLDVLKKSHSIAEHDMGFENSGVNFYDDIKSLRLSYDYIFFVASPIIMPEPKNDNGHLESSYREVFIHLLSDVISKYPNTRGFFYPSTSYLDGSIPNEFKSYCGVKSESESLLERHFSSNPTALALVRLKPFSSRHHSPILKTASEISSEELVDRLLEAITNWK